MALRDFVTTRDGNARVIPHRLDHLDLLAPRIDAEHLAEERDRVITVLCRGPPDRGGLLEDLEQRVSEILLRRDQTPRVAPTKRQTGPTRDLLPNRRRHFGI